MSICDQHLETSTAAVQTRSCPRAEAVWAPSCLPFARRWTRGCFQLSAAVNTDASLSLHSVFLGLSTVSLGHGRAGRRLGCSCDFAFMDRLPLLTSEFVVGPWARWWRSPAAPRGPSQLSALLEEPVAESPLADGPRCSRLGFCCVLVHLQELELQQLGGRYVTSLDPTCANQAFESSGFCRFSAVFQCAVAAAFWTLTIYLPCALPRLRPSTLSSCAHGSFPERGFELSCRL